MNRARLKRVVAGLTLAGAALGGAQFNGCATTNSVTNSSTVVQIGARATTRSACGAGGEGSKDAWLQLEELHEQIDRRWGPGR